MQRLVLVLVPAACAGASLQAALLERDAAAAATCARNGCKLAQAGWAVGGYKLEECLGAGMYGEVWSTTPTSGTALVVKIQEKPKGQKDSIPGMFTPVTFTEECVFARRAKRRNQKAFTDCVMVGGEVGGNASKEFAVLEKATGTSLSDVVKGTANDNEDLKALSTDVAQVFVLGEQLYQIQQSLAANNDNGVKMLHADMNPANLFVASGGNVVAIDYGLVILCCNQGPSDCDLGDDDLPLGAQGFKFRECDEKHIKMKVILADKQWLTCLYYLLTTWPPSLPPWGENETLGLTAESPVDKFLESALASKMKLRSPFKEQLDDSQHSASANATALLLKGMFLDQFTNINLHDGTFKKDLVNMFVKAAAEKKDMSLSLSLSL